MPGPAWWDQALCVTEDPGLELFTGDEQRGDTLDKAKAICGECVVRTVCLAAALAEEGTTAANMRGSIRGGMTPIERWAMSRPKKAAA